MTYFYFPCLQTCQINEIRANEYTQFLNKHKHLKHLHLIVDDSKDMEFQQMTENLYDIVELTLSTISLHYALSANVILEFLASHNNVKKLNVNIREDELRELLKNEWDARTNDAGLSFVRKTNQ